jgi:hypothetical protein
MFVMFQQGLFAVSIQNSVGLMEIFQMCLKNASSSTNFLTVFLAKLPVSLRISEGDCMIFLVLKYLKEESLLIDI